MGLVKGDELMQSGPVYICQKYNTIASEAGSMDTSTMITLSGEYVEGTPEYFEPEMVDAGPHALDLPAEPLADATAEAVDSISEELTKEQPTMRSYAEIKQEQEKMRDGLNELEEVKNELVAQYLTLSWVLNEFDYEQ